MQSIVLWNGNVLTAILLRIKKKPSKTGGCGIKERKFQFGKRFAYNKRK